MPKAQKNTPSPQARLVCKNIWLRPYLGGDGPMDKCDILENSRLDSYRVTCLLEQVDGKKWRTVIAVHKAKGPITDRLERDEATFTARSEKDARKKALEQVVRYIARIKGIRYLIEPSYKIGIFDKVKWENGTNFRFR